MSFSGSRPRIVLAVLTAILITAWTADVSLAFRCGNDVVRIGDTKADVLRKCGEPKYSEVIGVQEKSGVTLKLEEWYYEFGSNQFTRRLLFKGGRLHSIERGEWPK